MTEKNSSPPGKEGKKGSGDSLNSNGNSNTIKLPNSNMKNHEYTIDDFISLFPVAYKSTYDRDKVIAFHVTERAGHFATIRRLAREYQSGFGVIESTVTEHGCAILQHRYSSRAAPISERIDELYDVSVEASTMYDEKKYDTGRDNKSDRDTKIRIDIGSCYTPLVVISTASGYTLKKLWHVAAAMSFLTRPDQPQHWIDYFNAFVLEFDNDFTIRERVIVPASVAVPVL